MKFLVSSIKHLAEIKESLYYLVGSDPSKLIVAKSEFLLNPGDEIELSDLDEKEIREKGVITSSFLSRVSVCEDPKVYEASAERLAKKLAGNTPSCGVEEIDNITKEMMPKLKSAAELFLSKLLLGAPIIVRFHNDSDGTAGAYCLYKSMNELALEFKNRTAWRMQRGVSYSKEDAGNDILFINNFSSLFKPLLFLTDFGTALESNEGIDLIKEKFDIIWLEHHPIIEGFKGLELEHYINPWLFGGDSNYTAGLLSCTFSKIYSKIETKEIEGASLIGDYSKFAGEDGKELSEILELITSDTKIINSRSLTPYGIDELLSNEERKSELLNYARHHLDEALDLAVSNVKVYKSEKANLYLLDFKNVRSEELKYPLPGRFASKLLTRIETLSGKPCIVVLHFSSFISIRVSKELEIDLLGVLKEIKEGFSSVESSGGHKNAASIKLKKEESKKEVIEYLLKELGFTHHP